MVGIGEYLFLQLSIGSQRRKVVGTGEYLFLQLSNDFQGMKVVGTGEYLFSYNCQMTSKEWWVQENIFNLQLSNDFQGVVGTGEYL